MSIQFRPAIRTILCAVALFVSGFSNAQSNKLPVAQNAARQEFDAKDGYLNERVSQMGEDGLMMTSRSSKAEDGVYMFRYNVISTSLSEVEDVLLPVDRAVALSTFSFLSPTHFHQFIYSRTKFVIHSIPRRGKIKPVEVTGEFPIKGIAQQFTVVNNQAVIAARTKTGPTLLFIDWKTGDIQVEQVPIPAGFKAKALGIINLQDLSNTGEVSLVYGINKTKVGPKRWCIRYNANGEMAGNVDISPGPEALLMDVKVSAISKSKYIYSGTYTKNVRTKLASAAQGIFFAESDASTLKYVKFTNFLDLQNFVEFLPKKTQERIERRKERAADEGRELAYNYLMTIHPIVSTADGYFLVGEAFYPEYHTETYYVNGRPQTRRVFDGYQYTHAIVVKFDINGERKMDQCLGMRLVDLPMTIVHNISLNVSVANQVTLSYANDRYLVSKTFSHAGTEIDKKQVEVMSTGDEDEKIRQSTATMRHWYGPYFVAYGFQTIKKSGSGKRRVFYINKLQM
jgi:hypothetical protein